MISNILQRALARGHRYRHRWQALRRLGRLGKSGLSGLGDGAREYVGGGVRRLVAVVCITIPYFVSEYSPRCWSGVNGDQDEYGVWPFEDATSSGKSFAWALQVFLYCIPSKKVEGADDEMKVYREKYQVHD
ncbi:hypothetical protein B0J14DRAFT_565083 [Halenospora varia]|nr:hypothetical protein B0J14DRAFT_565083 [Halenospora varia]